MADVNSLMQAGAETFQKEFTRAKDAGCTDNKARRIALKRSKNVWNLHMEAMEKKYADTKPLLEEYARGEILKLQELAKRD